MKVLEQCENVCFSYEMGFLLKNISFNLLKGELIGIVGPNGAGKTSLLKIMAGLLKPLSGEVSLNGKDLFSYSHQSLAQLRSYIPSQPRSAWPLKVETLVGLGLLPHSNQFFSPIIKEEKIVQALKLTDSLLLKDRSIETLSDGERARVFLSNALVGDGELLLADEPIRGLDLAHQYDLMALLKNLAHDKKLGIVIVLHDLNLAMQFCDRLLILDNGLLVHEGIPHKVLTHDTLRNIFHISCNIYCEEEMYSIIPYKAKEGDNNG